MDTLTPTNSLLLYQSEDGKVKIDVRFEGETIWLSLDQTATLFGKSRTTVSGLHCFFGSTLLRAFLGMMSD